MTKDKVGDFESVNPLAKNERIPVTGEIKCDGKQIIITIFIHKETRLEQPRIISLSPWGTQILSETGLDRWLVGVSHKCRAPEKAGNLPVVTRPLDSGKPVSEDFLSLPRHFPTIVLSPYEVDPVQLAALRPSHILTESLSSLCHIPVTDIEEHVNNWLGFKVKIVHLSDANLNDLFGSVKMVIQSLGLPESKYSPYEKCQKKLIRTGKKIAIKKHQPLVGILIHYSPARFAGRYFSELIPLVGATPLNWPHDVWIPDPVYAYPPPHKIILADPDANLSKQKENFFKKSDNITNLWGANCTMEFFPVDGFRFWDKSCNGLITTLESIGEIVHSDPKAEQWKGEVWTTI